MQDPTKQLASDSDHQIERAIVSQTLRDDHDFELVTRRAATDSTAPACWPSATPSPGSQTGA